VNPAQDDDPRVPTLLVYGGGDDRDAAIARLAQPVAERDPIAVLRAGGGIFSDSTPGLGPHVVMRRVPVGCLCCTAGVMFRVAVLGLVHASRPARLLVDLGRGDHVAVLEAELQRDSLGRALRLVGRVNLDASPEIPALTWPADLHPQ